MNCLISFIIPVYNVEAYLRDCVNSIVSQCNHLCEIILVDDGSTDSSGRICDAFADNWECVKVIHQKNAGVSVARNVGVEQAEGEYITFVDSDDHIMEGSVSAILQWIENGGADLCFLEGYKLFPDGEMIPIGDQILQAEIKNRKKTDVLRHLSTRPKFSGSPWAKVFRKDFLLEAELKFPNDRRLCEDLGFCRDSILQAETFDALHMPYYAYRQNREGSRSGAVNEKSFYGMGLFVEESVKKLTEKKQAKDDIAAFAMSFAAYEYCIMLWQYSRLPKNARKKAEMFLRKYKWVLQFGCTTKIKTIQLILHFIGIKNTSVLLDFYMKNRVG